MTTVDKYTKTTALRLWTPDRQRLPVDVLEFIVWQDENGVKEARLLLSMTHDTYAKVNAEALFHLQEFARGPGEDFRADRLVEIEARLRDGLLNELSESAVDTLVQLARQSVTETAVPLLETESWYALHVTQRVDVPPKIGEGVLKMGYSTTWVDIQTT